MKRTSAHRMSNSLRILLDLSCSYWKITSYQIRSFDDFGYVSWVADGQSGNERIEVMFESDVAVPLPQPSSHCLHGSDVVDRFRRTCARYRFAQFTHETHVTVSHHSLPFAGGAEVMGTESVSTCEGAEFRAVLRVTTGCTT